MGIEAIKGAGMSYQASVSAPEVKAEAAHRVEVAEAPQVSESIAKDTMAMNTKGSTVEYKRLKIENPSELGKVKGEINDLGYGHFVAPPSPYRSKAIVEDLEDASTIMKGENL